MSMECMCKRLKWRESAFPAGIDGESSYPYKAKRGKCRYSAKARVATDKGFSNVAKANEALLQQAVASVGPVAIAIDASRRSLQFYHKGQALFIQIRMQHLRTYTTVVCHI